MKPVAFEYCRAETAEEAVALLAEFGGDASVLAGGMSLGAMLNMRLVRPKAVIDVNRIAALAEIKDQGGVVETGALVRQADALKSQIIVRDVPLLAQALPHVGHFQTRSRGTLGGSVAHADPSAEIPLCLVTLGGTVVLRSRGVRRVPAREFFAGVLTTARRADELVVALEWPKRRPRAGYAFDELAQRHGDFAITAAAAMAEVNDGKIAALAFGLGGVEDRPFAPDVTRFVGAPANDETARAIAAEVADRVAPIEDLQGTADYRRQLARVIGARVIREAFAQCSG
jgi:2-furoyl-CoA dehydrogenase FAD binding subunit